LLGLDPEVNELGYEFQIVRRTLDLEVFGIRVESDTRARLG